MQRFYIQTQIQVSTKAKYFFSFSHTTVEDNVDTILKPIWVSKTIGILTTRVISTRPCVDLRLISFSKKHIFMNIEQWY